MHTYVYIYIHICVCELCVSFSFTVYEMYYNTDTWFYLTLMIGIHTYIYTIYISCIFWCLDLGRLHSVIWLGAIWPETASALMTENVNTGSTDSMGKSGKHMKRNKCTQYISCRSMIVNIHGRPDAFEDRSCPRIYFDQAVKKFGTCFLGRWRQCFGHFGHWWRCWHCVMDS